MSEFITEDMNKLLLVKKTLIGLTTIALICFYYAVNPSANYFGPVCALKSASGFQCWGCGGQRALHELLHGNFHKAFDLNALVFPVLILCAYVLYAELFSHQPSYRLLKRKEIQISAIILIAGFTFFRNIAG